MEIIYDISEIDTIAKQFILFIQHYKVITLSGELGAGKTTFVNAICRQYATGETVTSPTYALIHEYHFAFQENIYHMDLYRIKNEREAIDAGVEDCITSGSLCFIEWPQVAAALLPERYVHVYIEPFQNTTRKLIAELR